MNPSLSKEKLIKMKKTKKLKKVTIKMGDSTLTYYINPSLNLSKDDDSALIKKKLADAEKHLAVDVFPPSKYRK